MKEYKIQDITEIADAIKSGEPAENDIGTVMDGFFWFSDEIAWATQWQKDQEQDSPDGYFAMLLDPNIFDEEDDEEEIMAGIEYWWHRSQIYAAAYLIINRPLVASRYTEDLANNSLKDLLKMQEEVKESFSEKGMKVGPEADPKDIWMIIRTTAQNIHNNVRGMH